MAGCALWEPKTGQAQPRGQHICSPKRRGQKAKTPDGETASGYILCGGQRSGNVVDKGVRRRLCPWPREEAGHEDPKRPR